MVARHAMAPVVTTLLVSLRTTEIQAVNVLPASAWAVVPDCLTERCSGDALKVAVTAPSAAIVNWHGFVPEQEPLHPANACPDAGVA
jgi:hypothetical protein